MYSENNKAAVEGGKSIKAPKYRAFHLRNFRKIPQVQEIFNEEELFAMEVVGTVLPFKANNYVVDKLIDWDRVPEDPIFKLTFPQRNMLTEEHFDKMASALKDESATKQEIGRVANEIRMDLNPHPAGQLDYNVPIYNGQKVEGMQHKYNETALFFPKQSQTCHAYCTFCFRWPQFVGIEELKFSGKDIDLALKYISEHPEITDFLFTGGDPMVLSPKIFKKYVDAIVDAEIPHLKTIRIGTKSLGYWPYKFFADKDYELVLQSFKNLKRAGKHVSIMAHFNHFQEQKTRELQLALEKIYETGANVRTQSPIFRYINDSSDVWATMWQEQINLKMIPYYMFMARDTGAKHYFDVPLVRAWQIYRNAYKQVSGLARTVRGPSMSCGPGKVQILGVVKVRGEKVLALRFLQGRNENWVQRPFFAEYDEKASWLTDLKPAFGEEKFFFEDELKNIYEQKTAEIMQLENVLSGDDEIR